MVEESNQPVEEIFGNVPGHESSLSDFPTERWEQLRADMGGILAEIGPTLPNQIAHLPATARPELVVAYLHRDGAVIIEKAISEEICEKTVREMQPYIDAMRFGAISFEGLVTKRVGAVVARSKASWDIVTHPLLMDVCAGVLGHQMLFDLPQEGWGSVNAPGFAGHPWQLHLTQLISIGAGEPAQPLHRDRWVFVSEKAFTAAGLEPQLSSIWALTEFTMETAPTRIVPGSHRWASNHARPGKEEAAYAVMPKGSVVIYTGSVWHSGGNNVSTQPRIGLNIDYSLGWLRQEENQFLACPPQIAKDFPRKLQNLVGYQVAGRNLGYFDGGSPKKAFVSDERPINWASDWQSKL